MSNAENLNTPRHIAVIMDGNGRWASDRGLLRVEGHRAGAESVRRAMEACRVLGVEYLTLYAFSTENWTRPRPEVARLMQLLDSFLNTHLGVLNKHGIRLNTIGATERLPLFVRRSLKRVLDQTRNNASGTLTLALNYGSRAEITRAALRVAEKVRDGGLAVEDITEELLAQHLYTADLPEVDLIIRTAGEMRLSNFLLWQASYAEFWSTPTLWPDFGEEHLRQAIDDYRCRDRRFGGIRDA